jgi:cob(I)alamin adenosyltransferase
MKFYSGKGDDGSTGLFGEERVSKADLRLEAIGALDELTAFLGNAKVLIKEKLIKDDLESIQRDLYVIMSDLADTHRTIDNTVTLGEARIAFLEEQISIIGKMSEFPKGFILPGETKEAAALGICRAVTRRAERRIVELNTHVSNVDHVILSYMNRLSSFLFLLEVSYSKNENNPKFNYAKV